MEWSARGKQRLARSDSSLAAIFAAETQTHSGDISAEPYARFNDMDIDEWLQPEVDCLGSCREHRARCTQFCSSCAGDESQSLLGHGGNRSAKPAASACALGKCFQGDGGVIRTVLMCINSGICIFLGCIMVELSWDDTAFAYLDRHDGVEQLKVVILLLTIVYEAQLVEYYWHSWRSKKLALAQMHVFARAGVPKSVWPLPPRSLALWQLPVEMIIGMLIPLPERALGFHERTALCLFLRLYLVVRLAHKVAPAYLLRNELAAFSGINLSPDAGAGVSSSAASAAAGGMSTRHAMSAASVRRVEFGAALSIKTLFDLSPAVFVVVLFSLFYFPITFSIYVQERDHQPEVFDLPSTAWFCIVTATVSSDCCALDCLLPMFLQSLSCVMFAARVCLCVQTRSADCWIRRPGGG
jgi:hypothetical protein